MKVILDGIVMEKYKGDAEVASYGSFHGDGDDDDSDATTASNDEATTVTAVTRATPTMPRERSELEVLGDDLQAYAFSASFLQNFEVILAGVHIVQRKPIVLQPLFRELMNQVKTRATTMSAPGTNNGSKQVAIGLGIDVIGSPFFEAFTRGIVNVFHEILQVCIGNVC